MAQTNKDARVRLETPTGQALVEAYSQSGLKLDAAWERRLPTIYRLLMAGLSANEIARMIGGDYYKVVSDIEAISYLLDEIPNIERVRADITVELDELYANTIQTLSESTDYKGGTKAKLIEQAREILMGKADLYGLRSATLNVNNNTRLLSIAAELKSLGSNDGPELEAAGVYLEPDRIPTLSTSETPTD